MRECEAARQAYREDLEVSQALVECASKDSNLIIIPRARLYEPTQSDKDSHHHVSYVTRAKSSAATAAPSSAFGKHSSASK